jgi:aspartyl protease family protein
MSAPSAGPGRMFAWAAVIGAIVGLTALFQALTRDTGGMTEIRDAGGTATLVLSRERNGHFFADGEINGRPVRFLIDTGATDVAVSDEQARTMGLEFGPEIVVMTAAGPARAWMTRIDSVTIGSLGLRNVRATITPGLGAQALLGMSFLKHFTLRQQGDEMIIEAKGASAR